MDSNSPHGSKDRGRSPTTRASEGSSTTKTTTRSRRRGRSAPAKENDSTTMDTPVAKKPSTRAQSAAGSISSANKATRSSSRIKNQATEHQKQQASTKRKFTQLDQAQESNSPVHKKERGLFTEDKPSMILYSKRYDPEFINDFEQCVLMKNVIGDWRSVGSKTLICYYDHLYSLGVHGCKVSDLTMEKLVIATYNQSNNDTIRTESYKMAEALEHPDKDRNLLEKWVEEEIALNALNKSKISYPFLTRLVAAMDVDFAALKKLDDKYFYMSNGMRISPDYMQEFKEHVTEEGLIGTYFNLYKKTVVFGAIIGWNIKQTKEFFQSQMDQVSFKRRCTTLWRLALLVIQVKCTKKPITAATCKRYAIQEEHMMEINLLAGPQREASQSMFHRSLVQFHHIRPQADRYSPRSQGTNQLEIGVNLTGSSDYEYQPPKGFIIVKEPKTEVVKEGSPEFLIRCGILLVNLAGRYSRFCAADVLNNEKIRQAILQEQAETQQILQEQEDERKRQGKPKDDEAYAPEEDEDSNKDLEAEAGTTSSNKSSSKSNKPKGTKKRNTTFAKGKTGTASMPKLKDTEGDGETEEEIIKRNMRHLDNGVLKKRMRLGLVRDVPTMDDLMTTEALNGVDCYSPARGLPFKMRMCFETGFEKNSLQTSQTLFSVCSKDKEELAKIQAVVLLHGNAAGFYLANDLHQWHHGQISDKLAKEIHEKSNGATYKYICIGPQTYPPNWNMKKFSEQNRAQANAATGPIRALFPGHPLYDQTFSQIKFDPVKVTKWIFEQCDNKNLSKEEAREYNVSVDLGFGHKYYDWDADPEKLKLQKLAAPEEIHGRLDVPIELRAMFGLMLTRIQHATEILLKHDRNLFNNKLRTKAFAEKLQKKFPGTYAWEAFTALLTKEISETEETKTTKTRRSSKQTAQDPKGVGTLRRHLDKSNDDRPGYENTGIWCTVFKHEDDHIYRLSFIACTRAAIGTYIDKENGCVSYCHDRFRFYLEDTIKEHPVELHTWHYKEEPMNKWENPQHHLLQHLRILPMRPFKDRCAHHSSFAFCIRKVTKKFNLETMQVCQLFYMAILLPNPTTFWEITTSWCNDLTELQFQERLKKTTSVFKMFYDDVRTKFRLSDNGNVQMNLGDPARYQPSCNATWEEFFKTDLDKKNKEEVGLNPVDFPIPNMHEDIENTIPAAVTGERISEAEDAIRARLPSSRYDPNWTVPQDYKMNIEVCAYRLMNFFHILNQVEENFDELEKSVVEHILALNLHGIGHLKAGAFLEIAVLSKLLPPSYIRCVSWNPEASYKKLKDNGCNKGKQLDVTKLRELGRGLATVFGIMLRETENVLCEVCKATPGVDVIFEGQRMYCVINKGTMDSKESEEWVLRTYDPNKGPHGEWGEDLEQMGYDFETPQDFPIQCHVPSYIRKNKKKTKKKSS